MGQPGDTVVVDASLAPILLLDLPYIASSDQAVGGPDSELEADSSPPVLATIDRLRDEQSEVTRWACNNGRSLVWGDCGHVFEWAVALYGSSARSVSVGAPLGPETMLLSTTDSRVKWKARLCLNRRLWRAAATASTARQGEVSSAAACLYRPQPVYLISGSGSSTCW